MPQTAATMTMNSPQSLLELFRVSNEVDRNMSAVHKAELMREVGLKCISFNGVSLDVRSRSVSLMSPDTAHDQLSRSLPWRLAERHSKRSVH